MEKQEIADFISRMPDKAVVVAVVQAGNQRHVFHTNKLDVGPFPNWPRAVLGGICDATGVQFNEQPSSESGD